MLQSPRSRHRLAEHEAAQPSWLELFYDLVFVAVFIQVGDMLSHDISVPGFIRVLVLFAPLWWVWANIAWYMSRFDADDVAHRLLLLAQIFFIAWMGLSVPQAFGEHSTQFVACYIGFRFTMIAMYARSIGHAPEQRELLLRHITHFHAPGAVLWAGSLLLPPDIRPLVWAATFIWEAGNTLTPHFRALMRSFPVHCHHLVERFGTLIILVMGETFIKSITVNPAPPLTLDTALFSAPAMAIFFGLWWLYFTAIDGEHAAGRLLRTGNPVPWIFSHLLLALTLIIFAVTKTKLFESIANGSVNPVYAAVSAASLATFIALLAFVAGDRRRSATLPRLAAAAGFALLIPAALVWQIPPIPLALLSLLVVAALIVHETRAAFRQRPDSG